MTNPGGWLRGLREELHLTRVGVERLTSESASRTANERYRIRRGRLADIEDGHSPPDIFEVASLSECYKVPYHSVLRTFGVQLSEVRNALAPPIESRTPQKAWSFTDTDRPFSLTFQTGVSFDTTRLVTESPEELGIPATVRHDLDETEYRFGIIGVDDDTMGELVPGRLRRGHRQISQHGRDGRLEEYSRTANLFRLARKWLQLLLVLPGERDPVHRALSDCTPANNDFQDAARSIDHRASRSRLAATHRPEARVNCRHAAQV